MPRRIAFAASLTGLVAVLAQSLIIRELVIAFLGNELVIGVALAAWLFWTGIGSATLGRLAQRSGVPLRWLALELLALAALLPASFFAATHLSRLTSLQPGEAAGPLVVILWCFAVLAPLCLLNGSLFATLVRALSEDTSPDRAATRVYVCEAAGAALAGLLFTVAVVTWSQPVLALVGCSLLAVSAAWFVRPPLTKTWGFALCTFVVLILTTVVGVISLDRHAHVNTIHGRTTVEQRAGGITVFHNGILAYTSPPAADFEPLVCLALLQAQRPVDVVLVGGLAGTAEAAARVPGITATIVELDPDSVDFVLECDYRATGRALPSSRMQLRFQDARRFIAECRPGSAHAIILNLPNPVTAEINRFYTVEFFRSARAALRSDGILAFQLQAPPTLATPEVREFAACVRRTLKAVFSCVAAVPGDSLIFLASPAPNAITLDADLLLARLDRLGVKTRQFDAVARDLLNPFRIRELEKTLAESASTRLNTDLRPVAYSHGLSIWAAQQSTPQSTSVHDLIDAPLDALNAFASSGLAIPALAAGSFILAAVLWLARPRRSVGVGLAVATGGFIQISLEIVLLLVFQSLYGCVYALLGLVLAAFMVGLASGALLADRIVRRGGSVVRSFLIAQAVTCVYPLLLLAAISAAHAISGLPGWLVASAFVLLSFIAGFTGGLQFPLAAALASTGSARPAARLYALDLVGASAGALIVSTFLIPTLGYPLLAVLLALLALPPLVSVLRSDGD